MHSMSFAGDKAARDISLTADAHALAPPLQQSHTLALSGQRSPTTI